MRNLVIVLIVLSTTFACAAVPPFGTWEWVGTEESLGVFTTPVDVGYTVQFDFNGDMSYIEYRDQDIHQTGVFWTSEVEFQGQIIQVLNFDYGGISPAKCAYAIDGTGLLYMYWGSDPSSGFPSYPVENYAPRGPVGIQDSTWGTLKALFR